MTSINGLEAILIKTFLIQTVDDMVVHDFSFTLIEAIKYHNWYYGRDNEKVYDYILQENTKLPTDEHGKPYKDDIEGIIPIGTVEFVLEYINKYYSIDNIKPINIPIELRQWKYTKRRIITNKELDEVPYLPSEKCFVKSASKIKELTDTVQYKNIPKNKELLISELVDIESEWRAFVFNSRLVGLQNYSGDFAMFPDVELIESMINNYKMCPAAYTLDVGINNEQGTFIIEVHDFFSCGLYGFSDHRILPKMFISTWNKLIGKTK
jgi:hypothetical protein